jgi:signal transduction histidine kinase
MEPIAPRHSPSASPPDPDLLVALLDCEADLDALERSLVAASLHPAGAGAEAAWWLAWDERRGRLVESRAGERGEPDVPLATAIARARRSAPAAARPEGAPGPWAVACDALAGACQEAWRGGEIAMGPGAAVPGAPWVSRARLAVVPLRRGPRAHGLLVLAIGAEGADPDSLSRLRVAAETALGAQLRAADARRRVRHVSGFAEFARLAVSAANLAEAMHALVRLAAQSLQVRHAAVFRLRDDGALALELAHGPAPSREAEARALQPAAAEVARAGRPFAGAGAAELPGPAVEGAGEVSAWALQPIVAYGRTLGVLAAWDGSERPAASSEWEPGDLDFLAALADQGALLFEHARRLEELGAAERRREDLAARLREQDRVAAVGELAARVAEDARAPLASMTAFAARALRELSEDDPRRDVLEAVQREAHRLGALLAEQSAYARLDRPRLRVEEVNAIVQEALKSAQETLARRRIRLVKKLAPDVPTLLLDAARIRRVIENILACALESIPVGGRLRVESRRAGVFVVLEVVHDRTRAEGDVLEQLFAPFGAAPASGAAIGLGVAQQIVREHGGEIRVRTEDAWSNVFTVTLPVMQNQDRRKSPDRRAPKTDRRRRDRDA